MLTTGVNTFTGTDKNDLFEAPILTLNAKDNIDGGAGTDVMNVTQNDAVTNTTVIKDVETINFTALGDVAVDMAKITGVDELNTTGSTGKISVTNASKVMALGFNGTTTNIIDTKFTAGALSGKSDELVVNMNSAKGVDSKVNAGFESATINVSGTDNTLTSFTAPGVTKITIAGSGNLNIADNGLVGVTDVTVTNTAALKTGDMGGLKSFTATANTTGVSGITATTTADPYSADVLKGASTGLAVLLGSGADNINVVDASATNKSTTVDLGANNDMLTYAKGNAGGKSFIFGKDGDDSIKLTGANGFKTTDYIDGGAGTDTLVLDSTKANDLTLNAIENITLTGAGTATTTINTNSGALAVDAQLAGGNAVNIAGLTAGSTVKTSAATAGDTFIAGAVTVAFKAAEATSTLDIAGGMDGDLATTNITNVTANLGAASNSTSGKTVATTGATDLTINATGAFGNTGGTIASTDNKLKNVTIVGQDAITTAAMTSAGLENVTVTAAKVATIGSLFTAVKLDSVNVTSSTDGIVAGIIGAAAGTGVLDVTMSAVKAITQTGAIDSVKIGNIDATSTTSTVTVGAIGSSAKEIGDITLSAKGNLGVGLIGHATAAATSVGTISMTSTDGKIELSETNSINVKDETGLTVNLDAKTTIGNNGVSAPGVIANTTGDVTAAVAGAAAANVNFTSGKGVVNLKATNTGGLSSTVINAGTVGAGETSTIFLGDVKSTVTAGNAIVVKGIVDTINVTGGTGKDTVTFTTATIKNGNITLGDTQATTDLDKVDFTGLAITGTKGLAMNFSSSDLVFSEGSANTSSVATDKVVTYDAAKIADSTTAADTAVVADGQTFTLSGVESVVGSVGADYIVSSGTGMTIAGGAGDDILVAGAGQDTLTGGAGADTFVFAAGTSGLTAATIDKITDFIVADDSLKVGEAGSVTGATTNFAVVASDTYADLAAVITAANTALSSTLAAGTAATQAYASILVAGAGGFTSATSYVAIDNNHDGAADQLIELVGNITQLTAADFIA